MKHAANLERKISFTNRTLGQNYFTEFSTLQSLNPVHKATFVLPLPTFLHRTIGILLTLSLIITRETPTTGYIYLNIIMPIKWTDQAHLTVSSLPISITLSRPQHILTVQQLLLKLLEQNPITKFDTEAISASWPGPEKATPRAIYEQIKVLRKRAETNSNGGSTSTSKTRANGKLRFRSSKPVKATFPARKKAGSAGGDKSKKRKRQRSDDEESEAVESSTTDAEGVNGEAKPRTLPVRKNRGRNHVVDGSDSEGLMDAAAKTNSDEDGQFVPEGSDRAQSTSHRLTDHTKVFEDERDEQEEGADGERFDEDFKLFTHGFDGADESKDDCAAQSDADEDVDVADGTRSITTMATRRTSWATACAHADD